MPLEMPINRKIIHNRTVQCVGYLREDKLWDIEGHLIDTKTYDFTTWSRGLIAAGQAIHDMSIRITLDDNLLIHDIHLKMSANPYTSCPSILSNFKKLIGIKIAKGFRKKVYEKVGGINGCTHMVEMLFPIATTAFQTIYSYKNKNIKKKHQQPALINSCHSWRDNGEVIKKEFPEFYAK